MNQHFLRGGGGQVNVASSSAGASRRRRWEVSGIDINAAASTPSLTRLPARAYLSCHPAAGEATRRRTSPPEVADKPAQSRAPTPMPPDRQAAFRAADYAAEPEAAVGAAEEGVLSPSPSASARHHMAHEGQQREAVGLGVTPIRRAAPHHLRECSRRTKYPNRRCISRRRRDFSRATQQPGDDGRFATLIVPPRPGHSH